MRQHGWGRARVLLAVLVLMLVFASVPVPGASAARRRSPVGAIDLITTGDGGLVLVGWAHDPDAQRGVLVKATIGGRPAASTRATLPRPDVATAHGVASGVGFELRLPDLGHSTRRLCLRLRNAGAGTNRSLGCRRVNVIDTRGRSPRGPLVINGVGDVRADRPWYGEPPDYALALAGLDGLFQEDGLSVINLECAPSELGTAVVKNFNFRCSRGSLDAFASAGVEVANMANNHALDYGVAAMLDGIGNVRRSGMLDVGAGIDAAHAYTPVLFDRAGRRIAVLGLAGFVEFGWNFATADRPGLASGVDLPAMTEAIADAATYNDVVIIAIHWGIEGTTQPTTTQRAHARAMVDAGADVVFGHHPHRLQPLERYNGGAIFYSLGNFVWTRLSPASNDTAVAQVIVRGDNSMQACLLPATIGISGRPTLDNPATRSC